MKLIKFLCFSAIIVSVIGSILIAAGTPVCPAICKSPVDQGTNSSNLALPCKLNAVEFSKAADGYCDPSPDGGKCIPDSASEFVTVSEYRCNSNGWYTTGYTDRLPARTCQ